MGQSGAPSGDENSSGPPPVRRAKTPQWGVFRARESPRWCTKKSRNRCCGFFAAPFPPGRTHTSRKRSCSSRGDWSLKMAASLWAGATIERERKRGANNVRRARRTTARAVLRSKMEALQADKRTGLNSLDAPTDGAPKYALQEIAGRFLLPFVKKSHSGAPFPLGRACDSPSVCAWSNKSGGFGRVQENTSKTLVKRQRAGRCQHS